MSDPFGGARRAGAIPNIEAAETIAIQALGYIASDQTLLDRFVGVTGIEPQHMRRAAGEPGFLAGVLQFMLAHEPTLLAFSEATGVPPASVAAARQALPLGEDGAQ